TSGERQRRPRPFSGRLKCSSLIQSPSYPRPSARAASSSRPRASPDSSPPPHPESPNRIEPTPARPIEPAPALERATQDLRHLGIRQLGPEDVPVERLDLLLQVQARQAVAVDLAGGPEHGHRLLGGAVAP